MGKAADFKLSVVVPAYNEAENIPALLGRIVEHTTTFPDLEIIVVDDGSDDNSVDVLRHCLGEYPSLRYISLSKNCGHQIALRAGMEHATGDCVVCLDADLQQPPELIGGMIDQWRAGAEIVNCIREDSGAESLFKRVSSRWFYRVLSKISGVQLVPGSSDFRLLDRRVVDILNQLRECDLFYRGMIPTLGFRVATISYHPAARMQGTSKYTLGKMVALGLNGVISTSSRPLRLATYFAFVTALGALSFLGYVLYVYFVMNTGVPGWASTLAVVLTIGTMQLLVLGVIGEYLGKVLKETRRRPSYYIADVGGIAVHPEGGRNERQFYAE